MTQQERDLQVQQERQARLTANSARLQNSVTNLVDSKEGTEAHTIAKNGLGVNFVNLLLEATWPGDLGGEDYKRIKDENFRSGTASVFVTFTDSRSGVERTGTTPVGSVDKLSRCISATNFVENGQKQYWASVRDSIIEAVYLGINSSKEFRQDFWIDTLTKNETERNGILDSLLGGAPCLVGINGLLLQRAEQDIMMEVEPEVEPGMAPTSPVGTVAGMAQPGVLSRSGADPSLLFQRASIDGGANGGYQTARILETMPLSGSTFADVSRWMSTMTDMIETNPLFWAGGWQQIVPYCMSELERFWKNSELKNEKQQSPDGKLIDPIDIKEKLKRLVGARIAFQTSKAAIFASDESLDSYIKFIAPSENMPDGFILNKEARKAMEEDPIVGSVLNWMLEDAYNTKDDGKSIKKMMSNFKDGQGGSLDKFIQSWTKGILSDKGTIQAFEELYKEYAEKTGLLVGKDDLSGEWVLDKVRTAATIFIVDEYAQWAEWVHKYTLGRQPKDRFSWYKEISFLKRRKNPEDTTYIDVPSFSSDTFGEVKTGIKHPFLALWEPVGLLRLKGGTYAEHVIVPLEQGMQFLAAKQFMNWEDQGKKDGNGNTELTMTRLKRPSEISAKNINRYGKGFMSIVKDFYGSGLEGKWEDLEDTIRQYSSMEATSEKWKYSDLGFIMSKVCVAKLRALRSGDPRTYAETILTTIGLAADDLVEEQKMLQEFLGGGKNEVFGPIRDMKAQYGLRIGTPELRQEIEKFITGVKKNAGFWSKVNDAVQVSIGFMNVAQGLATGKPGGSGKKK